MKTKDAEYKEYQLLGSSLIDLMSQVLHCLGIFGLYFFCRLRGHDAGFIILCSTGSCPIKLALTYDIHCVSLKLTIKTLQVVACHYV